MIYRQEYPRPQFVRKDWMNLNGQWDFTIDHALTGEQRNLQNAESFDMKINVPFCPESKLSGIEYKDFMRSVWYTREVDIPGSWTSNARRTFINIGACDYITKVFVNGILAGRHVGGYVSFSIEITEQLKAGKNRITIFAEDDTRSQKVPTGKQSFQYNSFSCFYTRSTGIWQTVWLENTPAAYLKYVKMTPEIIDSSVRIEAKFDGAEDMTFTAVASFKGKKVGIKSVKIGWNNVAFSLPLSELYLWDTENPNLYDITFTVGEDEVDSYFGMREIAFKDNKTYLNGKVLFQRLILDQGYYPDGIYTAPSEEDLINDIKRSMDMGFNGARLHEKIFEPLFLYHCDRLGYIVWDEFPNWGLDTGAPFAFKSILPEWLEELERDYNHPSVIGWCPLNETEANIDPDLAVFLFNMTKAYDPTRLFIDNSGWVHVKGAYDILDVHDYLDNPEEFRARYMVLTENKPAMCYVPFPVEINESKDISFVSEFGGIWWKDGEPDENGWGYGNRPKTKEEFLARYKGLMDALLDNPKIGAICYTQLTDVEQEMNGLYTYDRKPKFDPEIIKAITSRKSVIEE